MAMALAAEACSILTAPADFAASAEHKGVGKLLGTGAAAEPSLVARLCASKRRAVRAKVIEAKTRFRRTCSHAFLQSHLVFGGLIQLGIVGIDGFVANGLFLFLFFGKLGIRFAWGVCLVRTPPGSRGLILHIVVEKRNFPYFAFTF
jgi:hypothetical protein